MILNHANRIKVVYLAKLTELNICGHAFRYRRKQRNNFVLSISNFWLENFICRLYVWCIHSRWSCARLPTIECRVHVEKHFLYFTFVLNGMELVFGGRINRKLSITNINTLKWNIIEITAQHWILNVYRKWIYFIYDWKLKIVHSIFSMVVQAGFAGKNTEIAVFDVEKIPLCDTRRCHSSKKRWICAYSYRIPYFISSQQFSRPQHTNTLTKWMQFIWRAPFSTRWEISTDAYIHSSSDAATPLCFHLTAFSEQSPISRPSH